MCLDPVFERYQSALFSFCCLFVVVVGFCFVVVVRACVRACVCVCLSVVLFLLCFAVVVVVAVLSFGSYVWRDLQQLKKK